MSQSSYKDLANIKISARIKQVVVLIIAIILGILLSKEADARHFPGKKNKKKYAKVKYKEQNVKYVNACNILDKKHSQKENIRVAVKEPRYKPSAEFDPSAPRVLSNPDMGIAKASF